MCVDEPGESHCRGPSVTRLAVHVHLLAPRSEAGDEVDSFLQLAGRGLEVVHGWQSQLDDAEGVVGGAGTSVLVAEIDHAADAEFVQLRGMVEQIQRRTA